MKSKRMRTIAIATALVSALGASACRQDKYTVKVPGGLAFSEFKGYESWEFVSLSQSDNIVAAILANPMMIEAYKKGIPATASVPDGSRWRRSIGLRNEREGPPTTVLGA